MKKLELFTALLQITVGILAFIVFIKALLNNAPIQTMIFPEIMIVLGLLTGVRTLLRNKQ